MNWNSCLLEKNNQIRNEMELFDFFCCLLKKNEIEKLNSIIIILEMIWLINSW